MSLTILTICSGRTDYLEKQLKLLFTEKDKIDQHIFVQNGFQLEDKNILFLLESLKSHIVKYEELYPVGAVIVKTKSLIKSSHVLKLDDDAIPVSDLFLGKILEIIKLKPEASFSPFPVGLLKSLGGPKLKKGADWNVLFSKKFDIYFTIRPVEHLGGFCRVTPSHVYDAIVLDEETHSEDKEFSQFCKRQNIEMFYLDSGIIVEHAESFIGQKARNSDYVARIKKKRKDIKI